MYTKAEKLEIKRLVDEGKSLDDVAKLLSYQCVSLFSLNFDWWR